MNKGDYFGDYLKLLLLLFLNNNIFKKICTII